MTPQQLDVMQKLLLDFVWRGKAWVKLSVLMATLDMGGLKMLHVKNVVHALRVKWMRQTSLDLGLTWSRFFWPTLTTEIPSMLIQGLCTCPESALRNLDPFYAQIIQSYTMVNNLFYKKNKSLSLPINLWGHPKSPALDKKICEIDIYTVSDLPRSQNGRINHGIIQNKFWKNNLSY